MALVRRYLATGALTLAMIMITQSPARAEGCALTVAWEPFAPMSLMGEDGDPEGGVFIASAVAILAAAGCGASWAKMSWSETLRGVEMGMVDMAIWAKRTPARERFAAFTRPFVCDAERLFMRADDDRPRPETLEAMAQSGLRIGVVADAVYSEVYAEMKAAGRLDAVLVPYAFGHALPGALLDGEVDGFIRGDLASAYDLAALKAWGRVEATDLVLSDGALSFMLSRNSVSPETVAALDVAVGAFVRSPAFDRIYTPYWADIEDARPYTAGVFRCGNP